jgi:hypothetical protein
MLELVAALAGSSLTAVWMSWSNTSKTARENRDLTLRLTLAVETIGNRLEELHLDYKADRKETQHRLTSVETRVTILETQTLP